VDADQLIEMVVLLMQMRQNWPRSLVTGLEAVGEGIPRVAWFREDRMSTTRGVLYVHSAPSALCPHIEWAVGGAVGMPVHLEWTPQPAERASYRAEYGWLGPVGTAAKLASGLKGWQKLRFEVTEEASRTSEAHRYAYTPTLGIFSAVTGLNGDIQVPEQRLKHAVVSAALGGQVLAEAIEELLGQPWDSELEPFRYAGDGAPVRWLHKVV